MIQTSKGKDLIIESIERMKEVNNYERKLEVEKRLNIYKDNFKDYVEAAINQQFSDKTREGLKNLIDDSVNVTKRIINEISTVYSKEPKRYATLDSGYDTNYNAAITSIMDFNLIMQNVNQYTNLLNNCIVGVSFVNNRLKLSIYTPNNVDVIQRTDDPTQAEAIIITDTFTDTTYDTQIIYKYWDIHGNYKVYDADYNVIPIPNNEQGINPYVNPANPNETILPFVIFSKDYMIDSIFDTTAGNDVISATIQIGVLLTYLNYLVKWQSFKQLAILNADFSKISKDIILDPAYPIGLKGENASIQVLNENADIKQVWDIIYEKIGIVANNYGMSLSNFKLQQTAQSGFALEIQKEGLIEARQKQLPIYRSKENELFDVMRVVWNYHTQDKQHININSIFNIDFQDITIKQDPLEVRQQWKFDIMMGAKNVLDYIMTINPDIKNYEQAEQVLKQNVEINSRISATYDVSIDNIIAQFLKEKPLVK